MRRGDRREAYDLFYRSRALQNGVEWNEWLGRDQESTLLHCAAIHGMRSLYVALLERGGLPEQKASHRPSSLTCPTLSLLLPQNKSRQNCLHLICQGTGEGRVSEAEEEERRQMLCHTLEVGLLHMDIQHILAEKDVRGNTVLHYAAINGLKSCMQVGLQCGGVLSQRCRLAVWCEGVRV